MKAIRFFSLAAVFMLAACQNIKLGHHMLKDSDPAMRDISQESRPAVRAEQKKTTRQG